MEAVDGYASVCVHSPLLICYPGSGGYVGGGVVRGEGVFVNHLLYANDKQAYVSVPNYNVSLARQTPEHCISDNHFVVHIT